MTHSSRDAGGTVVAVLDRRGSDQDVVETAAEEAARRHAVLRLLRLPRGAKGTAAASALAAVRSDWPGLRIEESLRIEERSGTGSAADVLAREGADAQLLVVPQTVVADVVAADGCPVLVVPEPHVSRWHRLVVAAVEERPGDEAVVACAADEARVMGCELRLVNAYAATPGESGHSAADRAHRYVLQLLASARRTDGLDVSAVCTPGPLEAALARQAAGAELVVLGQGVTMARLLNVMRHCGSGIFLVRDRLGAPGRSRRSWAAHRMPPPRPSQAPATRSA